VAQLFSLGGSERTVKKKHLIVIGCLVVLVALYFIAMIPSIRFRLEWDRTVKALQSLPRERVDAAVQAFVHDRKASTAGLPATVTFAELVSGGYLRTNDVVAFGGKQAEVFLGVDESYPAAIRIRVRMPNGRDVVEMMDGSCMMLPPNKARACVKTPGRIDG